MRSAPITNAEALGRLLREARMRRGISQRALAQELGTTQGSIVELEAGKPTKAIDRLFDFARETGVTFYAEVADD